MESTTNVARSRAEPGATAGHLLLLALAQYGIMPDTHLSVNSAQFTDTYHIPVLFSRDTWGRLSIANRAGSAGRDPSVHTGWTMFLHDKHGEPVGDPVYFSGDGGLVDCAEDSEALAAVVAEWLTSPVSRHCDCYAQESHHPRHDRDCNRYRQP